MTSVDSAAAAGSFASGSQIDPVRPNDSPPAPEPSSSTSQLGQGRLPRPLTFDTLPPEIRTLVLSQAPDYNTLQALVLSSRVYYDSFSYSREQISRSVLRKYGSPVDGDITDLLLCFQTLQAARQTMETIARTFEQTKRFLARPHSDASVKTFAEVRSLLDISTAIEKVVDDYFAWALCRDPWTGKVRPAERAASSTERWRVRRAALRWYGYHLYFCSSEEIRDEFDHRYEFEFEDDEEYIEQANFKADHFFDLFTIGENEEIYSIHAYAQERYRQFFDRLDQHENWDRWWENKGITRWKKAEIYDSPLTYGEPIDFRPGRKCIF